MIIEVQLSPGDSTNVAIYQQTEPCLQRLLMQYYPDISLSLIKNKMNRLYNNNNDDDK